MASTAKLPAVRANGAAHVIDYSEQDVLASDARYDAIIDIAGRPGLRQLRRALTPTGRLVVVGAETGGAVTGGFERLLLAALWRPFSRGHVAALASVERGSDIKRLVELIHAGKLTPPLDRGYPLAGAVDAMRRLESGDVTGKVALLAPLHA